MTFSLIAIAAIAVASSVVTTGLAFGLYWYWGRAQLDAELLLMQDEFEKRVKAGVLAAGQELLPAFREQVMLGFKDALKTSHAAGIAEGTAKIVSGSTDLLVDSLSNLFGLKKK